MFIGTICCVIIGVNDLGVISLKENSQRGITKEIGNLPYKINNPLKISDSNILLSFQKLNCVTKLLLVTGQGR